MTKKEHNYERTPYDPDFKGPLEKRSCTDILCLGLFIVFIAAWVFVGFYAFTHGDPRRILYPTDSKGRICGIDEGVANKPYLFFLDIMKCASAHVLITGCPTPQICVEECPSNLFIYHNLLKGTVSRNQLFCTNETCKTDNQTVIRQCMDSHQCSKMYFPSKPIADRCIPSLVADAIDKLKTNNITINEVLKSSHFAEAASSVKEVGHLVIRDLIAGRFYIIGGICLAMVLSLIYIVILRWFACPMVWISILAVIGLLGYCVYATCMKYISLKRNPVSDEYSKTLSGIVNSVLANETTWLVFTIASAVVLLIILLMVLFMRKRIIIAVALIKEASKAVGSNTSSLIFPIFPWIFQCALFASFAATHVYLASSTKAVYMMTDVSGNNSTRQRCSPDNVTKSINCHDANNNNNNACTQDPKPVCQFIEYETPNYIIYFQAYNFVGLFWGMFFISGLGDMILAGVFATWYWTFDKSKVPFFTVIGSVYRTFRYHLGTVAFGSLLITICRIIRILLEYVDHKLKKYDNSLVRIVLCCCKCFFWCLEKFIKFINRNAYIMCAVHGKNFCCSARDAFKLLVMNCLRALAVDKVTDFLLILGKLAITAGIAALSFYIFDGNVDIPGLKIPVYKYPYVLVVILSIATYLVTCLFFNVFSMAVDTLFLCFLEDCERNDGSTEKPYYMSKNLMKILGKKNKKGEKDIHEDKYK